jgi:hypothetical protein
MERFFVYDLNMKKIILCLLTLLVFSGCGSQSGKQRIEAMSRAMEVVDTVEEEAVILTSIWNMAYENQEFSMTVGAVDAEGNSVINELPSAIEPVKVTILLSDGAWWELIEFEPLDIENVYILLDE